MKIIVAGNCQARPVTSLINQTGGFETLPPIILHLSKDDEQEAHERAFAEADVIFAQATAPNFRPTHLVSSDLKARYPGKVVVWPNMFYSGQHPYARYLTHDTFGRISGPLEATHDLHILRDWMTARGRPFFDVDIDAEDYTRRIAALSLKELQKREEDCDVRVSDLIAANISTRQLFFTFNHPTNWLIARLTGRLLAQIGAAQDVEPADPTHEPLGLFRPPSILPGQILQGPQVNLDTPGKITTGPLRVYTPEELREISFACYDHQAGLIDRDHLRITPNY